MSRCATVSRSLDEPVSGTAATATTWLLLEQPGPWGANALTSSHLDRALGRALERAADGTGVRVALIRRPGRHADPGTPPLRHVYAAHTVPGNVWLHSATVRDPNRLLGLDFAAVAQIHAEIMAARNRGAAVLLVSEDLDELLELSDRLVVMFHGEFVYEARTSEADLTEIGRHMAGH